MDRVSTNNGVPWFAGDRAALISSSTPTWVMSRYVTSSTSLHVWPFFATLNAALVPARSLRSIAAAKFRLASAQQRELGGLKHRETFG